MASGSSLNVYRFGAIGLIPNGRVLDVVKTDRDEAPRQPSCSSRIVTIALAIFGALLVAAGVLVALQMLPIILAAAAIPVAIAACAVGGVFLLGAAYRACCSPKQEKENDDARQQDVPPLGQSDDHSLFSSRSDKRKLGHEPALQKENLSLSLARCHLTKGLMECEQLEVQAEFNRKRLQSSMQADDNKVKVDLGEISDLYTADQELDRMETQNFLQETSDQERYAAAALEIKTRVNNIEEALKQLDLDSQLEALLLPISPNPPVVDEQLIKEKFNLSIDQENEDFDGSNRGILHFHEEELESEMAIMHHELAVARRQFELEESKRLEIAIQQADLKDAQNLLKVAQAAVQQAQQEIIEAEADLLIKNQVSSIAAVDADALAAAIQFTVDSLKIIGFEEVSEEDKISFQSRVFLTILDERGLTYDGMRVVQQDGAVQYIWSIQGFESPDLFASDEQDITILEGKYHIELASFGEKKE